MLQKNVYLIYPAGHSGTYLKWAIEISDLDCRQVTPLDPINSQGNPKFGGQGTAHRFTRIPTHQGYRQHINWVIYNRPTEPKIYLINRHADYTEFYRNLASLLFQDPNSIIINIHDNDDRIISSYGRINCVTKWPSYLEVINNTDFHLRGQFDAFNCQDDIEFRNYVLDHEIMRACGKLDWDQLRRAVGQELGWYETRNRLQPHEVNEETYISTVDYNRVYEMSCLDIVNSEFPDQLRKLLNNSGISDNFDCDYVEEFHVNYINAQQNLKWFSSFLNWQKTGELDDYLLSHSIVHAELIREMFWQCGFTRPLSNADNLNWQLFYLRIKDPSWPECNSDYDFYRLPKEIQNEITLKFGYVPILEQEPEFSLIDADWRNMSVVEINDLYQKINPSRDNQRVSL